MNNNEIKNKKSQKSNNLANPDDFEKYLNYCYKTVLDYKKWRKIYLELNIGFTSFFSLALNFLLDYLIVDECGKTILIYGFLVLLASTLVNICFNLMKHKTDNTRKTWYHYRHHFDEVKSDKNIKEKEINYDHFKTYYDTIKNSKENQENEDLIHLYNLYKFQSNYYDLLSKTRRFTLISLTIFIGAFGFSFFISRIL